MKMSKQVLFFLFIGTQIFVIVLKYFFFPEETIEALVIYFKETLILTGWLGYSLLVSTYVISAFFFIPVLILLNILSGAVYGPWVGTVLSIFGITLGSIASVISIRYIFKGIPFAIEKKMKLEKLLHHLIEHGDVMVVIVRLSFIVPYVFQNIVLALTKIKTIRLGVLTFFSAAPGCAAYSLIGAGIMEINHVRKAGTYIGVGFAILLVIYLLMKHVKDKYKMV